MIRWSETSTAPTWRPRQAARSRVATARSMKYCSGVGRIAARRASARSAVGVGSMPAAYRGTSVGGDHLLARRAGGLEGALVSPHLGVERLDDVEDPGGRLGPHRQVA